MKYLVTFKHRLVEFIEVEVEADSEEEALRMGEDGELDWDESDVRDVEGEKTFDYEVEENI